MTSGSEHVGLYVPDMTGIERLAARRRPAVENYGAGSSENAGHCEFKRLPLATQTAS